MKLLDNLSTSPEKNIPASTKGWNETMAAYRFLNNDNVTPSKILMSHIGGKPPNYNKRVRDLMQIQKPDIFICGHSHILRVIYDEKNSVLYINPGAAGKHGFHKVRTVIRFDIVDSRPKNMEVIELGKRA